jgi:predicted PhzF superfamily epimerase YddE/YHI9
MNQKIAIVDAFTDKPFSGNPAAVCVLERPISDEEMKQIAAEVNLSETAFILREEAGYRLRWFTPKAEVKLCGHGTLATAHLLWEEKISTADKLEFFTSSGTLTARKCEEGIELNFPVEPMRAIELPAGMDTVIGAKTIFTGKSEARYVVELGSAEEIRRLTPDLNRLKEYAPGRLVVTAKSDDPRYDFISRYFAPALGIPEDPVTGAAHCALAPYWSKKLMKNNFVAHQASSRGGEIRIVLEEGRVKLIGRAVTVLKGAFVV